MGLIRELQRIQQEYRHLPAEQIKCLAERTRTKLSRIEELISFFPHFRREPPPELEVHVCRDMTCHLRKSAELIAALVAEADAYPGRVAVHGVSCLGRCDRAPALRMNEDLRAGRDRDDFLGAVHTLVQREPLAPDSDASHPGIDTSRWQIEIYDGESDFRVARRYAAEPEPQRILKELEAAGLRGMGGAGEETHKKWATALESRRAVNYVVCNGDESEPATFKDRELLLRKPHLVVEGVALACLFLGAGRGYVYIRDEYPEQIEAIGRAIEQFERGGVASGVSIEVFRSPGGYICGEQSALIEAMEDRRAEPRNRPPQLTDRGLHDCPTILNNVETFAWVPAILDRGGEWFRGSGCNGWAGRRFFSISGDVNRPGVYEVPVGLTLLELIEDFADGLRDGRGMKAVALSGPSGGLLPRRVPVDSLASGFRKRVPARFLDARLPAGATELDVLNLELDLQLCRDLGVMLGSGMVVYGDGTDMVEQAVNCLEFFERESCGKCVPCRLGTQKLAHFGQALLAGELNRDGLMSMAGVIGLLGQAMEQTSICGLGTVAANPLTSLLRFFPGDVDGYLK